MSIPTPAIPTTLCTRALHIERAAQGFTMCVDCRRPLFPPPKNKCRAHAVYCCPDCFTNEEIAQLAWERNGSYSIPEDVGESADKKVRKEK